MKLRNTVFATILLAGALALADDSADNTNLAGTWSGPAEGPSSVPDTWTFENKGDKIQVTHKEGDATITKFQCNTMGKECEIKDAGKKAAVSLWFNGAKLVELETRGNEVTKRRFGVVGTDAMDVEVIPIAPSGKSVTEHLKRVQTAAHS